MEKIDVTQLRQQTEDAIRRGNEERERELANERAEALRAAREEILFVRGIVAQIPSRAQIEATSGRSHAIVMALRRGKDYDEPDRGHILEPYLLKGSGKSVYCKCVDANLKPTLEFWWDGGGMDSGFNIVVHW